MNKQKSFTQVLPAALVILSAAIFTCAQDRTSSKINVRPNQSGTSAAPVNENKSEPVKYTYEFSQPKFVVKHIVIEHDANGRGTVTFERLNEDTPVVEKLELSAAALARINAAWQALQFLDSNTNYQADKQFPHLGTMRIGMEQGTRKRVAEFNWTENPDASTLATEYRRAADQAILIFD
ncbi:MAG TPA: hypothetical protein VHH35_07865, partial [Pyrinomonadaceae bacterium]|nr:hypothetical protein [Pyrinomonadaceae bacterium]